MCQFHITHRADRGIIINCFEFIESISLSYSTDNIIKVELNKWPNAGVWEMCIGMLEDSQVRRHLNHESTLSQNCSIILYNNWTDWERKSVFVNPLSVLMYVALTCVQLKMCSHPLMTLWLYVQSTSLFNIT